MQCGSSADQDALSTEDIVVDRTVNATPLEVYDAYTKKDTFVQWFLFETSTLNFLAFDARVPGGRFFYHMKCTGPPAFECYGKGTYTELVPGKTVAYIDAFADEKGNTVPFSTYGLPETIAPEALVTITFTPVGDGSAKTLVHHVHKVGTVPKGYYVQCKECSEKMLDKLVAFFDKKNGAAGDSSEPLPFGQGRELVIERTVDAPPSSVFQAWSSAEQVKQWWGPDAFHVPLCNMDFRVGGVTHLCMEGLPDAGCYAGYRNWCGGMYREIVPNQKIVSTSYFTDEAGNRVSPQKYGIPEGFPEESLVTVTFEPVEEGKKTKMTLRTTTGSVSDEFRTVCTAGWTQQFEKLNKFVQKDSV
eukprot:ANDGO_05722.mRNA.1 hypothetical protein